MISPLIRLFVREPELLANHLGAYLELAREDLRRFRTHLQRRVVLMAITAGAGLIGLMLVGVAALLWAEQHGAHWAFLAIPLAPLLLALACGIGLSRPTRNSDAFERIWDQLEADLKVLGRLDNEHTAQPASDIARQAFGGNASGGQPVANTAPAGSAKSTQKE